MGVRQAATVVVPGRAAGRPRTQLRKRAEMTRASAKPGASPAHIQPADQVARWQIKWPACGISFCKEIERSPRIEPHTTFAPSMHGRIACRISSMNKTHPSRVAPSTRKRTKRDGWQRSPTPQPRQAVAPPPAGRRGPHREGFFTRGGGGGQGSRRGAPLPAAVGIPPRSRQTPPRPPAAAVPLAPAAAGAEGVHGDGNSGGLPPRPSWYAALRRPRALWQRARRHPARR